MHKNNKRLFLGLPIDKTTKAKINEWQLNQAWPFKPVEADNYHITLVFLGSVGEKEEAQMVNYCNQITVERFELQLTDLAYWKKPKAIVINTTPAPTALTTLAETLTVGAKGIGIWVEDRPYHPHLTVYRKANELPKNEHLNLNLKFDQFCLFHSKSTENGVKYIKIKDWPLV